MLNERLDLLRNARVPLHPMDARDYHVLCRVLGQIEPQVIIHLAGVAHAGRSNKDPYNTFDHSLRTLENALDWARGNCEHFIFLSSSMVYGNFQVEKVDEEQPLNPIGIYGALKVAGEKIVIAYQQVFGLPYTILRPSALYGPRCVSRRVGQIFIESAFKGESLKVSGDGMEKLDFTYVQDLVEGIAVILRHPAARTQIFNMTYGQSRSVLDLISVLREYIPGVREEYTPRDPLMPMRGTLSVEKASRLLGYKPGFPLELGMARYIQWYETFLGDASSAAA
jgi:nucleoside-diphosphate-sugar epimerase